MRRRCCCVCCKQSPSEEDVESKYNGVTEDWVAHTVKMRNSLILMFVIFTILGFITIQIVLYGIRLVDSID